MSKSLFNLQLLPFSTFTKEAVSNVQEWFVDRAQNIILQTKKTTTDFSPFTCEEFENYISHNLKDNLETISSDNSVLLRVALCIGLGIEDGLPINSKNFLPSLSLKYHGIGQTDLILKQATTEVSNAKFSERIKNYKYLEDSSVLTQDTKGNMRLLLALLIGFGLQDKINVYETNFYDHLMSLFSSITISTDMRYIHNLSAGIETPAPIVNCKSSWEGTFLDDMIHLLFTPFLIVTSIFGIGSRRLF
jgi:hypothetical protein